MEYGRTVQPNNSAYPFQWLLSKVTDANGNFVKYAYKTNTDATQTVLDYIEYGGNDNISATGSLKIEFNYGVKNHIQKQWISGSYFEDYHLLQNIIIKSNQTQLRNYHLIYDYRDEKHFMTSVKLTNETGESLPATTIAWGDEYKAINVKNGLAIGANTAGNVAFVAADVTGDGISDLIEMKPSGGSTILNIYKASGTSDYSFTQYASRLFATSFSDKYATQEAGHYMMLRHYNKTWISMLVANSDNTFFELYDATNANQNTNYKDILLSNSMLSILHTIADFNNDGNDEILYVNKSASFTGKIIYLPPNVKDSSPESIFYNSSVSILDMPRSIFHGDFNADGLIDVAIVGYYGAYFYKNNGGTKQADGIVHSGFSLAAFVPSLNMGDTEAVIKPGDFNGDGLLDFLRYNGENGFTVHYNNGNFGFINGSTRGISLTEDTCEGARENTRNDSRDDFIIFDYNNDGKSDLIVIDANYHRECSWYLAGLICMNPWCAHHDTTIKWYASTGSGFSTSPDKSIITTNEDYYFRGYSTVGDFDGDGKEDLFSYNCNLIGADTDTYLKYKIYTTSNAANADVADYSNNKVTQITNGMNNHTKITYQPISVHKTTEAQLPRFYEKGDSKYPVFCIQMPLYCVRNTNEGNDNVSIDTQYRYIRAQVHWQGKGFLGFVEIEQKNPANGEKVTNYITLKDSIFVPASLITRTTKGEVEKYFDVKKSGKIISSQPSSVKEMSWLTGLSKTTKYLAYDSFGNPTKTETTQGGLVQTNTITYIQRGAWCANKPNYMQTVTSYQNMKDTVTKTFDYDTKGNPIQEVLHPGKPLFKVTTEYADLDTFGQPRTIRVKAKDKDGVERTRTSYQTYTPSGRFLQNKTSVLGETTAYQWDEMRGLLSCETNHRGKRTDYAYDSWGNLKTTRYPDGNRQVQVLQWAGATAGKPAGAKFYSYAQTSLSHGTTV
ncbi:MAG: FG-GAP-like repeat-containing protein [Dysgonamonadaceae bacterium]|nr:FG-GAP-like repeat-containing protein [Dysgonamonadaceae bacterium]